MTSDGCYDKNQITKIKPTKNQEEIDSIQSGKKLNSKTPKLSVLLKILKIYLYEVVLLVKTFERKNARRKL